MNFRAILAKFSTAVLLTAPHAGTTQAAERDLIVRALTLSHVALAGKVLVGCEYAHLAAGATRALIAHQGKTPSR
ncbi:hypothetical protein [Aquabacterium sp.]|uniref:hypothetical protein n=1 Tax=Aquabacterium sp. TaxID=1872578 RepID=UPI003784C5A5